MRVALASLAAAVACAPAVAAEPAGRVERALQNASKRWSVPYRELRSVSWCESRWQPNAVGVGSYGLFQFVPGTWRSTPYGHRSVFDPWWNALAAAWLVRRTGGWSHWTCKP